ncbi:MAG TPA: DUF6263 family protein [Puia sp.]|nr:DUF6263 family protein [Puia sp.]
MRKFPLLFILIISISTQISFGQKQRLELNLTVGNTYYHNMTSTSNIKEDLSGQSLTITMTISGIIAYKVKEKKDSVYKMDVSYQELELKTKLPNGEAAFSSERNDLNDITSTMLSSIKGQEFYVEMTRRGKIIRVKGLDSILEKMLKPFAQLTDDQKQQMKGQLGQAFGEKAFKGSFEMITAIYPAMPVEVGNSWTVQTKLESTMSATLSTTYTLKEKSSNYILITGKGTIKTADKSANVQINGMPAKYDLQGTMISSLKLDNVTGWIMESKANQNFSGNAIIKDNPKLPGGLTIPMSIESEIIYNSK